MTDAPHITCIGVANVDVITNVDDNFLHAHNLPKGASALVDAHKLGYLLEISEHPVIRPGGSTANLACGLGLQGLHVDFVGKIGGDTYGAIFKNDFSRYGVHFSVDADKDRQTSTCLTLVTPDHERSFVFSTGTAGWFLKPADLPNLPNSPQEIVCIETNTTRMPTGYSAEESVFTAALIKYGHSRIRMFIGLNDREIISEARMQMRDTLTCPNVTLMGNLTELLALFDVHDMAIAFQKAQESGRDYIITNGGDGVYLIGPHMLDHLPVPEIPESEIIDTIGAGDQFAAGFIAAMVAGKNYQEAARQGIETASQILKVTGGRPRTNI